MRYEKNTPGTPMIAWQAGKYLKNERINTEYVRMANLVIAEDLEGGFRKG